MSLVFIPLMCLELACFRDCSLPGGSFDMKTKDSSLEVFCCINQRKVRKRKLSPFIAEFVLSFFCYAFYTKHKWLKSFGCCPNHMQSIFRGNPSRQDTCDANLISTPFVRRKPLRFRRSDFGKHPSVNGLPSKVYIDNSLGAKSF